MSRMDPLELVSAHPWEKAVFTTYALSLSFFEAVVLDALVRGGGRAAHILADLDGVRTALSEDGARRVGRDYEVEPIGVRSGVFHAKMSLFFGREDGHLLVGSGNLTFGGWGINLECLEHLHPTFAGDAFLDAAQFFERMADSERLSHRAAGLCGETSERLRRIAAPSPGQVNIRLLHNIVSPISEQILQIVDDLGGATRLVVAAPFFDSQGGAIGDLCDALKLDHAFVHAHHSGGTVEGKLGTNWPSSARVEIRPISLDILDEGKAARRLHAKLFEISCSRGRVVLSGSPNLTSAALRGGLNVEACVARIQREASIGWRYSPSEPLAPRILAEDTEEELDERHDILRAMLDGDVINGHLIGSKMSGTVQVLILGPGGLDLVGETSIESDGSFTFPAPGLELQSWKSGRLILRLEDASGRAAEGFVSIAAFSELVRRAGNNAARLIAILTGTETPDDVAAVMAWFQEDPLRLVTGGRLDGGAGSGQRDSKSEPASVSVDSLGDISVEEKTDELGAGPRPGLAWERFMGLFFSSIQEPRGPFPGTNGGRPGDDDEDDSPGASAKPDPRGERQRKKAFVNFNKLFDALLAAANGGRYAFIALSLANYVCERLRPEYAIAKAWLRRALNENRKRDILDDTREIIASGILLFHLSEQMDDSARRARLGLLRIGWKIDGGAPSLDKLRGFLSILNIHVDRDIFWESIATVRTYQEQVRSYLTSLKGEAADEGFADLQSLEEWSTLEKALTDPKTAQRLSIIKKPQQTCPKCYISLPTAEYDKLRSTSVCTARGCCGRVIVASEI